MATGADFKADFFIKWGEVGGGYVDDTSLNSFAKSALIKMIDPKVEQYGIDKKITREMQDIIDTKTGIVPVNGTVDISPTSTDIPLFYSEIEVKVTSPYLNTTITKVATVKNSNEGSSPYNGGIARHPKYQIATSILALEPADATFVDIQYFIRPIEVDVSDDTDIIPYNEKLYNLWIDATVREASEPAKDMTTYQMANQDVKENP